MTFYLQRILASSKKQPTTPRFFFQRKTSTNNKFARKQRAYFLTKESPDPTQNILQDASCLAQKFSAVTNHSIKDA